MWFLIAYIKTLFKNIYFKEIDLLRICASHYVNLFAIFQLLKLYVVWPLFMIIAEHFAVSREYSCACCEYCISFQNRTPLF